MIRWNVLVLLGTVAAALGAQTAPPPLWSLPPAAAQSAALEAGKPVLLLWQAGPNAAAFTQAAERLFASWPAWTAQAAAVTMTTRGRSWDAALPPSFPLLPSAGKVSCLVLWLPGNPDPPVLWTEVPPILELSRQIRRLSGGSLDDPYRIDVVEVASDAEVFTRIGDGPLWTQSSPSGSSQWVEEGPFGTVLVLKELNSSRRAALPLDGDWSFLYAAADQSWVPWKPVLVKRR